MRKKKDTYYCKQANATANVEKKGNGAKLASLPIHLDDETQAVGFEKIAIQSTVLLVESRISRIQINAFV
jgi:hypothetical protein